MERFTGADRAFCVHEFYRNMIRPPLRGVHFENIAIYAGLMNVLVFERLRKNWVHKFGEADSTLDEQRSGRLRTSRTEENIDVVRYLVHENPTQSIRKHSRALNILRSTLQRILKKDKKFHPYKVHLVQELKDTDATNRISFVNEMMNRFTLSNNVLFSDEAHFYINSHVSRQNCR
ncbi:hypothetical protein EVAR_38965_1 [Eumeta japonica]|uniref:Uncharacterized protein n=1 Tax=Eumeta variegata TaxID=151549 RepID=A0A4C1WB44_EUMVA|nr:hypothetical protein EVAR_38965_1 [Eumeta japonica]